MIVDHLALLAFAVFLTGALVVGSGRRAHPAPSRSLGPNTLEELFAARFARGDIDETQYLTNIELVAEQLRP